MKVEVPEGAVQVGQSEDGRWAVLLAGEGLEGALMLDPKLYNDRDAEELGAMLWRVFERWTVARRGGR